MRRLRILGLLVRFLFICVCRISAQNPTLPTSFSPKDNVLINCGDSGSGTDSDGRLWKGDAGQPNLFSPSSASFQTSASDSQDASLPSVVPYQTARVFDSATTYKFKLSNGRHWVRLHFYPVSYAGRDPANAFFSVSAGQYTLLSNFSAYITAQAFTQSYIMREFSLTVESGALELTFTPEPSPKSNASVSYYAFVNGIEIVSMPDLFGSAILVGTASVDYSVADSYAMQTMARLNVGGSSISASRDSNLSRTWYDDTPYTWGAGGGVTITSDANSTISYTATDPPYFAPVEVYSTARSMGPDPQVNNKYNLTWLVSVDANFTYLARLHFCELVYTKTNQRVFDIFLNNQTAYQAMDVIAYVQNNNADSGENTATFVDFAVYVGGADDSDTDLWVALHPNSASQAQYDDSILNGLEIFKVNDSSGNLAGPNPVPVPEAVAPVASPPPTSSSSKKGPLIGAIVGGVAALVLVGILVCCFCCRNKSFNGDDGVSSGWIPLIMNSYTMGSKTSTKSGHSSIISSTPAGLCRYFTFAELKEGTNNFDESLLLGVGGFGNVYKGVIDGKTNVAVKRGNPQSEQGVNEFQTEIEMLSKLRHKHLVSLIGFCEEKDEMILVYDYMANGTLRTHLYKGDSPPLTWKQRLEICIGAARGLHYLHTGARHTIIHRDVKTTNILLDDKFVAKVSDFGLSKTGPSLDHTHVSTVVKGSFGYLDPEYFRRQQLTEKSDVYSFGVVLFEVLCARAALNPALPREQVSLSEWALHCMRKGTLEHIIDPHLKGTINADSLKKFADIASKCLGEKGSDRPSMGDVLWNLEFALQLQNSAIESNAVDDCVIDLAGQPNAVGSANASKDVTDSHSEGISLGAKSNESEESDDATASVVFSQLVNPAGR